ncbi:MAG: FKBP-type peptidyl-prolyl cis-trans isomerase [Cytophagaceae bacterium]|nr:FKBP-type peptidyl-prolyl cis-trans isomerase [Cytophagaceae bacterium]
MKNLIFLILCTFVYVAGFSQKKDTVTTKSGLKYVQIKAGNGVKPKDGQKLKVMYRGTLKDGTVFDQNMDTGIPFKFTLGKKEVIPGWEEGFKLMSVGEKAYLIIPAKLAYGKNGVKNEDEPGKYVIPPNADLIFEVELVSAK